MGSVYISPNNTYFVFCILPYQAASGL